MHFVCACVCASVANIWDVYIKVHILNVSWQSWPTFLLGSNSLDLSLLHCPLEVDLCFLRQHSPPQAHFLLTAVLPGSRSFSNCNLWFNNLLGLFQFCKSMFLLSPKGQPMEQKRIEGGWKENGMRKK